VNRLKVFLSEKTFACSPLSFTYDFFFAVFFTLAGRLLPNEPLKIFPFFVFLSPFPIIKI